LSALMLASCPENVLIRIQVALLPKRDGGLKFKIQRPAA